MNSGRKPRFYGDLPMNEVIYFNRSSLEGRELEFIFKAVASGKIAGDQNFSKKCHALLEEVAGVRKALATTSCTHALEMAAILLNIHPGDEVILPAFTFVSTANAFVLHGAHPVFCDIRPDTLNLDETKLEALITAQTRAIVPVHYAGVGCEMDAILEIAGRHGVAVVEDNAHGLFGKYRGRWLGTFGCLATQSFHETKNITCGEGGALLINEERFIERAEIIREKGTNRARFFRGQVDKYSWVDVGSSYVMSDVLAAFLYGQLEKWREIQAKRRAIWERYDAELADWAAANGVQRPVVPEHCEQAWHMYYLLMPSLEARMEFIARLKEKGITAVFHYLPLNRSAYAAAQAEQGIEDRRWKMAECPVTEDVSDRVVRLPFYTSMSQEEQKRVIEEVKKLKI
jgi:dTDP-4-amino-4,6-dideoxygalactose transaminase